MIEIVAEVAQGFEGRPEQARLLMKAAATAGADAVKYQLVYADELATPDYKYFDLFRSLEMPDAVWADLAALATTLGKRLYVDVFGTRSLALADRLGLAAVKLHGTDTANIGFLREVARAKVGHVMLGAGGAHAAEIDTAIETLSPKRVTVILGFQGYPTMTEDNHISRVAAIAQRYRSRENVNIAFADHALPDSPLRYAIASTALGFGARMVEKHVTLGRVMQLEDHESALNPDEFAEFCATIRGVASAIGSGSADGDFGMSAAEGKYRKTIRRSIVAAEPLRAGVTIKPEHLKLKRCASPEAMTDLDQAYGKRLRRALAADEPVTANDLDSEGSK